MISRQTKTKYIKMSIDFLEWEHDEASAKEYMHSLTNTQSQ